MAGDVIDPVASIPCFDVSGPVRTTVSIIMRNAEVQATERSTALAQTTQSTDYATDSIIGTNLTRQKLSKRAMINPRSARRAKNTVIDTDMKSSSDTKRLLNGP